MPDTKVLRKLAGKKIREAKVYLGGAFMEQDDRSLVLEFTDGTSFEILVMGGYMPKLEGVCVFFEKPVGDKDARRKELTKI